MRVTILLSLLGVCCAESTQSTIPITAPASDVLSKEQACFDSECHKNYTDVNCIAKCYKVPVTDDLPSDLVEECCEDCKNCDEDNADSGCYKDCVMECVDMFYGTYRDSIPIVDSSSANPAHSSGYILGASGASILLALGFSVTGFL
ncbi:hypothetical protein AX774_g4074 [Zancudomyces culisetae]|uniref:Uncharacterized protein n=1 Tax=Zancudomyces culisetae TaxID=1213189 RepID=A0A1R1PNE8_ZANCU|nr:hypothetical protein AX774_g4074 [Zancudomyces culisetae]|eukprot:OMH82443.1 hypothetical protein AX774_g4074 [Zancudomyces culisetae]